MPCIFEVTLSKRGFTEFLEQNNVSTAKCYLHLGFEGWHKILRILYDCIIELAGMKRADNIQMLLGNG